MRNVNEIAAEIRNSEIWDLENCAALCEAADGDGFEAVVEAAAEKLGVEIY